MTECEEVADSLKVPPGQFENFDEALGFVRHKLMPEESETIISNVAWALYSRKKESQQ